MGMVLDYALNDSTLVGVRGGFNIHSSPPSKRDFASIWLFGEARATFVFGDRPLVRGFFHPYTLVGVGVADSSARTEVMFAQPASTPAEVEAYRIAGPWYTTVGAGIRLNASPTRAFMLTPLKMTFAFGYGSMPMFSPEFSWSFGF